MKKLKLKLEGKAMLTKDQMRKISGGYSGDNCCYISTECDDPSNTDVVYGFVDIMNNNTCNVSNGALTAGCQQVWPSSKSDGSCTCVGKCS
jgi:hypothetical protein